MELKKSHLPVDVKNLAILRLVVVQEILELLVHDGHHLLMMVAEEEGIGCLHLLPIAVVARHLGECRVVGAIRRGRGI